MTNIQKSVFFILASLMAAGCVDSSLVESNLCPDDPDKDGPGICGCGVADIDTDGDTVLDCKDECPEDSQKQKPGICGCGIADVDENGDTVMDCIDLCPNDPNKTAPGACGCGKADIDTDGDTVLDCMDLCEDDPSKSEPGECGCGIPDINEDGTPGCVYGGDKCPDDPNKTEPGQCGCGVSDEDSDSDTVPDCLDLCQNDAEKTVPGVCGCGLVDKDSDGDTVPDCFDKCPDDPDKVTASICPCGIPDSPENLADRDGDTVIDCLDECPDNPDKSIKGERGCGDRDYDRDGVDDGQDDCPNDPKIQKLLEGQKCNVRVEDGMEVFEIWNAKNLDDLRKYLGEMNVAPLEGMLCDKEYDVYCLNPDKDGTALMCQKGADGFNVYTKIECGSCTVDTTDGKHTCMCAEATDEHKIGECCDNDEYKNTCVEGNNDLLAVCKSYQAGNGGKMIQTESCHEQGDFFVCKNMGEEVASKCEEDIPKEVMRAGGNEGDNCSDYTESCLDSTAWVCIDNKVTKQACANGCNAPNIGHSNLSYVFCDNFKVEKPVLRVRMMADIALSDIVNKQSSYGYCASEWNSIDLDRIEFDGNGKTIQMDSSQNNCALTAPLFGKIEKSTVKNLHLKYPVAGSISAAFANVIIDSEIDTVFYDGDVKTMITLLGETNAYPGFGILAYHMADSRVHDIDIKSSISATVSRVDVSSFVNQMSHSSASNIKLSVHDMSCESTNCYGLIKNVKNESNLDNFEVTIDNIGSKSGTFRFYGMIGDVNKSILKDSKLHIVKLKSDTDNEIIGLANNVDSGSLIKGVDFNLDELNIKGSYKTTGNLLSDTDNLHIKIDKSQSSTFYGLTEKLADKSKHQSLNFKLSHAKSNKNIYGFASVLDSDIDNAKIEIGNLNAENIVYGFIRQANAKISNSELSAESVIADKDAFGFDNLKNVSNTALSINHLRSNTARAAFVLNIPDAAKLENVSVYADVYAKKTDDAACPSYPFAYEIVNIKKWSNFVSSGRSNCFTDINDTGLVGTSSRYENQLASALTDPEPQPIPLPSDTYSVFWYSRDAKAYPVQGKPGYYEDSKIIVPFKNNDSKLVYTGDDGKDILMTDKLGANWSAKDIKEKQADGTTKTVKIPWYTPKKD